MNKHFYGTPSFEEEALRTIVDLSSTISTTAADIVQLLYVFYDFIQSSLRFSYGNNTAWPTLFLLNCFTALKRCDFHIFISKRFLTYSQAHRPQDPYHSLHLGPLPI